MSLWLASAFAIASIFIWAITCTLSYKPVQFKTYFDTTGQFSRDQFEQNDRWRRVSRIGLQALGTLSIPLTSAVCTKAVVAYSQRSSNNRQPTISMRQTLVLADEGWLDLNMDESLWSHGWTDLQPAFDLVNVAMRIIKNMLPRSAGTMILTFLQAFSISILQGAFIDTISITVMTNADTDREAHVFDSSTDSILYSTVGTTLSMLSGDQDLDLLPSVIEATIAGKAGDLQPNLWLIGRNSSKLTSMDSFYSNPKRFLNSTETYEQESYNKVPYWPQTAFQVKPFFTSSLTVGTDTGILRALALRMSTSLQCQDIKHAEFPSDCNGTASLAMNFTNTQFQGGNKENLSDTDYISPIFSFHICSPGPNNWARDNDSSHSIREELYLDVQTWPSSAMETSTVPIRYNFTYHCIADSTLAYFEPMNEWNGHQVQDMVDIKANDVPHFTGLNTRSNTHELIYSPIAPGPLATPVRALFGNNTFFSSIVNANDTRGANLDVCRALRLPLTGICTTRGTYVDSDRLMCNPYNFQLGSTLYCLRPTFDDENPDNYWIPNATADSGTLAYFLYMWLQKFNNWNSTMAALTLTNFYSARAILDPSRAELLLPYSTADAKGDIL